MAASMGVNFTSRFCSVFGVSRRTMNFATAAIFFILIFQAVQCVDRPRGVPIEKMPLYNPSNQFRCFDGSKTIDFDHVNDDYCDCTDGSDEPGTSACPNGVFTCQNKGHIPKSIPSSRVNDGICDCCDGSDEYGKHDLCENKCIELGRAVREEMERRRQRLVEGNAVYLEYVAQGETAKKDNKERLEELIKQKEGMEQERHDLDEKKKTAEEPETIAKDAHRKTWEEAKAKRQKEFEDAKCLAAFTDLDADNDGSLSFAELKSHLEFDGDGDGEVGDHEAKDHLGGRDSVDADTFRNDLWVVIKSIYQQPLQDKSGDNVQEENKPDEDPDDDKDLDAELEDDKVTDDTHEQNNDDLMPEYDADTKKLIEAADFARAAFNEIDTKYTNLEREIRDLEEVAGIDFGPQEAFYPLKGQCFEFTDREYTYKLCPFDRASQRSKNGGMETNLGRWGSWGGTENDRYSRHKYEGGQNCWNGPDRSLTVHLHCGKTNELTSVSEPNRCEYHADFYTPALCSQIPPPVEKDPLHDEL